jgi:hypothetical protein
MTRSWFGLCVGLAACGPRGDFLECDGRFEELLPTVDTSADVPSFAWDHGRAYVVTVTQDDVELWTVSCRSDGKDNTLDEGVCIDSPLAYGAPATGRARATEAQALVPGEPYTVEVGTMDAPPCEGTLFGCDFAGAEPSCGDGYYGAVDFVAP